jgi:HAMP domain-containing protein
MEKSTFYTQQNYFVSSDGQFTGLSPYGNSADPLMALQPSAAQKESFQLDAISGSQQETVKTIELESFEREPVIAAYAWIPGLKIGWVGEVSQASVYRQVNIWLVSGLIILLSLAALSALLAGAISQRLSKPIRDLSETVRLFAAGNWEQRAAADRQDEIGLLAFSFNQMAEEVSGLYRSLKSQIEKHTLQIQVVSEVVGLTSSASSLDELLSRLAPFLHNHFDFTFTSWNLVDQAGELGTMRHGSGSEPARAGSPHPVRLAEPSLIKQAISTKRPQSELISDSSDREDLLPGAPARAALPVLFSDQVIGVLVVQTNRAGGFPGDQIEMLQFLVNSIAPTIRNFSLLEAAQVDLEETRQTLPAEEQLRVESVTNQAALALENARLLQEAQSWAARERIINAMTERAAHSTDLDVLLKTAVRELGQLPNLSEVSVHIGPPDLDPTQRREA